MQKFKYAIVSALFLSITFSSNVFAETSPQLTKERKEATSYTIEANEKVASDKVYFAGFEKEYQNATANLIEKGIGYLTSENDPKKRIWDMTAYGFLSAETPPDSVNPALWGEARLNAIYGLFKVADGIYQVRGYDVANITFIATNNGWFVFDTGATTESAKYAYALVTKHFGKKPIKAILYSHPHVDHYAGVKGLVTEEEVKKNNIQIFAPDGFMEHAVSENVYAGTAMSRRSTYQFGNPIEKDEKGQVDAGMGKTSSRGGTVTLIAPNRFLTKSFETVTVDRLTVEFQLTPGTEAPVEMNIYIPAKKAFFPAENTTGSLHQFLTLRGAQIRDGLSWSKYINDAIERYPDVEVVFASHNWPHFGNEECMRYLKMHRDMYRYIHDATLNLMNKGYTIDEVGRMIELPEPLKTEWTTHGFYGSLYMNSKAVYQYYLGHYNGNPSDMNKLLPEESAKKYVEYMGGSAKVIDMAVKSYKEGDYWWVAEIMNKVVFAEPNNAQAKYLCADALEQIGYQTESGIVRSAYLTAAAELRNGVTIGSASSASLDTQNAMTIEMILDYLGIRYEGKRAENFTFTMNLKLTDGEYAYIEAKNGVVNSFISKTSKNADVSVEGDKLLVNAMLATNNANMEGLTITGNKQKLQTFLDYLSVFKTGFNIVTP